ncbi:ABC transporter ATP-binding protein [Deinococcus aerolatus]|uniref:ABC transporter ATP-binding protein n=1 Tax=Deinococcus aerolatus TaxID=522487 RepID=UPI001E61C2E2|nr:ABC transporter ATP-binding protein [Deinococcus aerolatus]
MLGELSPFGSQLLLALALLIVGAVGTALGPYLISRAIDINIAARDAGGLAVTMGLLALVYGLSAVASRAQTYQVGAVGQRVLLNMRAKLLAAFQRLPLGFFDSRSVGDLMSRIISDVETLNQLLSQGITQLLGSLFGLIGIIVAMLLLDVKLALVSFILVPVMLLTTSYFSGLTRKAFRLTRVTVGAVTAELQEEITGVRQAQAFGRGEENILRFQESNAANRDANVQAVAITSAFAPAIDIISTLGTALVIGYGGFLVFGGNLTVGLLAAFLIYVQQFFRPLQLAAQVYTQLQSALAGAERIYAILDETPEAPDAPSAQVLTNSQGRVEFEGVDFAYVPGKPVLRGIDFTIEPGMTVALVGPTGAGKTSIANLIPRFYEVSGGALKVDGVDVRELTRASLRSAIAIVPQESFLFSGSVADNIAYGQAGAERAEVEAAARAASAHDFITALPQGYDTLLSEGGSNLSQGQRQLVAFARAILADPRILILDEATSNVDTRTERTIQDALAVLLRGRSSVVIAHRLSTIVSADLILVIEAGQIKERGSHKELLQQGGLYADLYSKQFRGQEESAA